jgi:hypothetical protein
VDSMVSGPGTFRKEIEGKTLELNAFTRELTELCRKHAVGIEGGQVWEMDMADTDHLADRWAMYAIDGEGNLVRTF